MMNVSRIFHFYPHFLLGVVRVSLLLVVCLCVAVVRHRIFSDTVTLDNIFIHIFSFISFQSHLFFLSSVCLLVMSVLCRMFGP
jgi:hypothetical protein